MPRPNRLVLEPTLKIFGQHDDATIAQGVRCDDAGCAVQMPDGRHVTIARRADAFADDCEKAALIVTTCCAPASKVARK